MIEVAVCGALGKMGASVLALLAEDGEARALCGIDARAKILGDRHAAYDNRTARGVKIYESFAEMESARAGKPNVIIDFSSPAALESELEYAIDCGVPAVIGTTGITCEQIKLIESASRKIAIFRTANFSIGVNLLCALVRRATEVLGESFDVEIIEKHHNKKVDAPSGTAKMLTESVNEALDNGKQIVNGREGLIGRRGKEIGVHAVRGGTVVGEHEVYFFGEDEIITLSHSATSKRVFAAGAIAAGKWLYNMPAGLYDMNDLLNFNGN